MSIPSPPFDQMRFETTSTSVLGLRIWTPSAEAPRIVLPSIVVEVAPSFRTPIPFAESATSVRSVISLRLTSAPEFTRSTPAP